MFAIRPMNRSVPAYDPFAAMAAFRSNIGNDFFTGSEMMPLRTDIRRDGDNYILESDLPGFAKEDIAIELNGDVLTIKAERSSSSDEKDEDKGFVRRERSYGRYIRSFDVTDIETGSITAAYDNGVLTITMPRKQETLPSSRRLEIM